MRGADVALLTNPLRTSVLSIQVRQGCAALETGIVDLEIDCRAGEEPLHSRPPLQVEMIADGLTMIVLVNHLKSKRGGAEETAAWRMAQASHLNEIVGDILRARPRSEVIALGDFNDYGGSAVRDVLIDRGHLVDGLATVPSEERYSYIFDGISQLIDWIVVSPGLANRMIQAGIWHGNADFPIQLGQSADPVTLAYRSSDHDVPYIIVATDAMVTPSPAVRSWETPEPLSSEQASETGGVATGQDVRRGDEKGRAVEALSTAVALADVPVIDPTVSGGKTMSETVADADGPSDRNSTWPLALLGVAILLLLGAAVWVSMVAFRRRGG
jgi:hypothetical protein